MVATIRPAVLPEVLHALRLRHLVAALAVLELVAEESLEALLIQGAQEGLPVLLQAQTSQCHRQDHHRHYHLVAV